MRTTNQYGKVKVAPAVANAPAPQTRPQQTHDANQSMESNEEDGEKRLQSYNQSSVDSHLAQLQEESKEFEQLSSASKRARKKSVGEKVSHLMFRKSEAIRKH